MFFENIVEVQTYIQNIYAIGGDQRNFEHFQIQYIGASTGDASKHAIILSINRKKTREKVASMRFRMSTTDIEHRNEYRRKLRVKDKDKINKRQRDQYSDTKEKSNKRKRQRYAEDREKNCKRRREQFENVLSYNRLKKAVDSFKSEVRKGSFCVCVICNRTLYKRSVMVFDDSRYNVNEHIFESRVISSDGKEYICKTCHAKLLKGLTPCQAVSNSLEIMEMPEEFSDLRKLEKVIITIMPKGQSPKIRGAVCNVPINADDICNILPRGIDNNGVVQVALKKRLQFK